MAHNRNGQGCMNVKNIYGCNLEKIMGAGSHNANPFPAMKTGFPCVYISTLLSLQGSSFHYRDIPYTCSLFYPVRDCSARPYTFRLPLLVTPQPI